jgi:transcriptional regulator with XRE-family HTH domain
MGECRRPIEPAETPYLAALGIRLRDRRRRKGLTQAQLAAASELSLRHLERIETGSRRTRRSTLSRIATALGDPSLEKELAALAGPALAPESAFAERVARRRKRRARKRERSAQAETRELLEALETTIRLRRVARSAQARGPNSWSNR